LIEVHFYRTSLVAFIRKQGKAPSVTQRKEIAKKRERLRTQVDRFHDKAEALFPMLDAYDVLFQQIPYGDDVISDAEDDDPQTVPVVAQGDVEKMELLLPSTFPGELAQELQAAAKKEIELRIAQAQEALEGVRREICHKSYIYRTDVRLATNKKGKTRGYAALHSADHNLRHHIRVYRLAKWSLEHLNVPSALLSQFHELLEADIQPLKAIYKPNASGESMVPVPWIWKLSIMEGTDSEYLNECKCLYFRVLIYLLKTYQSSVSN
jgi:hypothetical protein